MLNVIISLAIAAIVGVICYREGGMMLWTIIYTLMAFVVCRIGISLFIGRHKNKSKEETKKTGTRIIKGIISERSKGVVKAGKVDTMSLVEYIRVNDERIRKICFDSYIGTAIDQAIENESEVEFVLYNNPFLFKNAIVAFKNQNGEVSRANFLPFQAFMAASQYMGCGLILAIILGVVGAFKLGGTAMGIGIAAGIFGLSIFIAIGITFNYSKARNTFGMDG